MAKPYSMDLRDRAMARLAAGESSRVVAALKVAVSSVIKWAARERRFGSVAPDTWAVVAGSPSAVSTGFLFCGISKRRRM
jgi:transposase